MPYSNNRYEVIPTPLSPKSAARTRPHIGVPNPLTPPSLGIIRNMPTFAKINLVKTPHHRRESKQPGITSSSSIKRKKSLSFASSSSSSSSNSDSDSNPYLSSDDDEYDLAIAEKTLHPTMTLALKARDLTSLSTMTVIIYDQTSALSRNLLLNTFKRVAKRVIVVEDADDAISVIKRNNSDPNHIRSSVRMIIWSIHEGSATNHIKIAEYVESRLTDPRTSKMESIPIIMTVPQSTINQIYTYPIVQTPEIKTLALLVNISVVCGYIPSSTEMSTLVELCTSVVKHSAAIYAAYLDLKSHTSEFKYPKYIGKDEIEHIEVEEAFDTPRVAAAVKGRRSSDADVEKKAWEMTKKNGDKNGILKQFAVQLVRVMKEENVHSKITALTSSIKSGWAGGGNGGFVFDDGALERKGKGKPKVGLSMKDLRPPMYSTQPERFPPGSKKSASGFYMFNSGSGNDNENLLGVHVGISPDMVPFVVREVKELESPRTSRGLSKSRVLDMRELVKGNRRPTTAPAPAPAADLSSEPSTRSSNYNISAQEMPMDLLQYDLLEIKPAQAHTNSANFFLRQGYNHQQALNYPDARIAFSKAIQAERYNTSAWFCRGVANDKLKDYVPALNDFGRCLKITYEAIHKEKMWAKVNEVHVGDVSTTAIRSSRDDSDKKTKAARERTDGRSSSVSMVGSAPRGNMSSVVRDSSRGSGGGGGVSRTGGHGDSNMKFNSISPHEVTLSRIYFNRGLVYCHTGEDDSALSDFAKALKRDPKDKLARAARAMVLRRVGDFYNSQKDYIRLGKQVADEEQERVVELAMSKHRAVMERRRKEKVGKVGGVEGREEEEEKEEDEEDEDEEDVSELITSPRDSIMRFIGRPSAGNLPKQTSNSTSEATSPTTPPTSARTTDLFSKVFEAINFKSAIKKPENADSAFNLSGDKSLAFDTLQMQLVKEPQGLLQQAATNHATFSSNRPKPVRISSVRSMTPNSGLASSPKRTPSGRHTPNHNQSLGRSTPTPTFGAGSNMTKKERALRREVRGGTLGGLASTIDRTPEASPRAHLQGEIAGVHFGEVNDGETKKERFRKLTVEIEAGEKYNMADDSDSSADENEKEDEVDLNIGDDRFRRNKNVNFNGQEFDAVTGSLRKEGSSSTLNSTKSNKQAREDLIDSALDLKGFKASIGFSQDFFHTLFSVPTDVQRALVVHPEDRDASQLQVIGKLFKEFKLTNEFTFETMEKMASVCEYRTVAAGCHAYLQGEVADALMICLSGSIAIKMSNDANVNFTVGGLGPGDYFGDYSLLMSGANAGARYFSSSVVDKKEQDNDDDNDGTNNNSGTNAKRFGNMSSVLPKKNIGAPLRESYLCSSACEFVIFLKKDFEKYLKDECNALQKEKYQILTRSKLFKDWSTDSVVRLARLSRLESIPRTKILVEQDEKCEFVYFIQKGICKMMKFPDRCAQLRRDKRDVGKELAFLRAKYSYHRSLSSSMSSVKLSEEQLGERKKVFRVGTVVKGTKKINDGKGVYIESEQVTAGELKYLELEAKLVVIDKKIARFSKEDARSRSRPVIGASSSLVSASGRLGSKTKPEPEEIETLVAPAFFGAEAILDPERGVAMGTVVTDTAVTVLVSHKLMFQAFDITTAFLDRVHKQNVVYPDDIELAKKIEEGRHWEGYKLREIEQIRKEKWPVGRRTGTMVKQLGNGRTVVVEDVRRRGKGGEEEGGFGSGF